MSAKKVLIKKKTTLVEMLNQCLVKSDQEELGTVGKSNNIL